MSCPSGTIMQAIGAILLLAVLFIVGTGCSTNPGEPPDTVREKAVEKAVGRLKQELMVLSTKYPSIGGIGAFPHSHLGFTFANNAVTPRVYIVVTVEDHRDTAGEITTTLSGKPTTIPGTEFTTVLQVEGVEPDLRKEIGIAYSHLIDSLKRI